jgi:cysteinyl-tRNA synthetase
VFASIAEVSLPSEFVEAMDTDFNVPGALAALHDAVRAGNQAIDAGDKDAAGVALSQVTRMAAVLGLELTEPERLATAETVALIEGLIEKRTAARNNKDFAQADLLRAELTELGVTIEDQAGKTVWMWSN